MSNLPTYGQALLLSAALAITPGCGASHAAPSTIPVPGTVSTSPATRQLRAELQAVFGAPIMSRGVWAVDVRSLETGEVLYELNAGKLMMPASNMKIITMAAAAEVLGWDYRFRTTLESSAPVVNGVLEGDLIVRSNGDPTINKRDERASAVLDEWAAALREAGIVSIAGRIIGDDQAFDDEGIGAGWAWDYLQYGYAAPVGALQFNENIASLTVLPSGQAGEPAIVNLTPGSGFTILNRAVTGAAGSPETVDYKRHIGRPILEISGSVPIRTAPLTRTVSRSVAVLNPTVYFAQGLKDGLTVRGIPVVGEAVDFDDVAAEMLASPAPVRVLASTESPPLTEIGTVLMKVSQNLYAETLLKAAGAAQGGLGTAGAGRRAVVSMLKDWGVPADSYVIFDGSGLSRYNYVTARAVTSVLERMHRDDRHREPFAAALPVAGRDGTIAARMRRSRAEGNAQAKTGSIANVRALSGYVETRDGEALVFSILTNDFVIPSATVNWIADLGVEILANFTRR